MMTLTQISVFIENRKGRLAYVSSLLAEEKINIYGLSLADTSDFGILRLIVSDTPKTEAVFRKNNLVCRTTPVIGVEVPDRSGSLADLLRETEAYSVEYMYAMRDPVKNSSLLVIRFEEMQEAVLALKQSALRLVGDTELQSAARST